MKLLTVKERMQIKKRNLDNEDLQKVMAENEELRKYITAAELVINDSVKDFGKVNELIEQKLKNPFWGAE